MDLTELRQVTVKTVTFHNPDNGYSVLKLTRGASTQVFAAVGHFPRLSPGETLDLLGQWVRHETFGEQFRAESYQLVPPSDREAMERYLGGGAIKGIGPILAKKLVERFGEQTLEVLDRHPERLDEIRDLRGRRKAKVEPQTGCPLNVRFIIDATVTTNGPTEFEYFWDQSDGNDSRIKQYEIKEAGSVTFRREWLVSLNDNPVPRWMNLIITGPKYKDFGNFVWEHECLMK
jgi:ATP-dependent exoDNAse (exonuclease V) alpha subunit